MKKKPSKQTGIPTKNESNKGDSKGEKSFKINPKDLERERKANKKALEEIAKNRSEKKEKTLNEKFEDSFKDAFKKSLKPATQIPKTAKDIPIELFIDKVKDTTKIIITEAKLNASEKGRKKFEHRRNPGEPPKPRNRKSPKKEAFHKWVNEYRIDTKLTLNRLAHDIEEAYYKGEVEMKIGRDTVRECLKTYRSRER